ncbi:hypothetical protein HYZ70_01325, partial [Candidatus Curtissbacteria bacterium]|nr:hypothetical protein [Candidatus Curtissbacteria bacterium]
MSGIYQMVVAEIVNIIMLSKKKILTFLFYATVGIAASLALFIAFYWSLRLNASIDNLIRNYMNSLPLYFWPYVILTLATIVLFGVSIALLVYRFRKFGMPKLTAQGSTGLGSLIGIAASACPICGSTILSAIGITGGLAAFPLGGLELKTVSLGLMAFPIWLLSRDIKKLEADCTSGVCPAPSDPSFKRKDKPWMFGLMLLVGVLMYVAWGM